MRFGVLGSTVRESDMVLLRRRRGGTEVVGHPVINAEAIRR